MVVWWRRNTKGRSPRIHKKITCKANFQSESLGNISCNLIN